MIKVVAFWWFDPQAKCRDVYTYTADHVRRLQRMVAAHLAQPHEFVCVTDRPEALAGDMRTVRLDRTTFVPATRYAKLMLFRPDIASVIGDRMLYLDLDCVVTGALDPIVDRPEPLVLWRNPNFGQKRRARYNSSIILLSAGARPELWATFDPNRHPAKLRQEWGGTDQAWISTKVGPEEAHWTAADGVYGAGRLCDVVAGVGTELPADARVVFFPGSREPTMPSVVERHPWITRFEI